MNSLYIPRYNHFLCVSNDRDTNLTHVDILYDIWNFSHCIRAISRDVNLTCSDYAWDEFVCKAFLKISCKPQLPKRPDDIKKSEKKRLFISFSKIPKRETSRESTKVSHSGVSVTDFWLLQKTIDQPKFLSKVLKIFWETLLSICIVVSR